MSDWTRNEASDELGANAWVLDEMRDLWAADPTSVDDSWRALFEGEPPRTQSAKTASPAAPADHYRHDRHRRDLARGPPPA